MVHDRDDWGRGGGDDWDRGGRDWDRGGGGGTEMSHYDRNIRVRNEWEWEVSETFGKFTFYPNLPCL